MVTNLGATAGNYDSQFGEFVSDDHVRLAKVLSDYRPGLSLVYIPKHDRLTANDNQKPWAIEDNNPLLGRHIIRYLTEDEMKNPAAVLAWIFDGDLSKHRPVDIMDRIENEERAQKLLQLKKQEDELEDIADHMAFYLTGGRNKLNYIRHDKNTMVGR